MSNYWLEDKEDKWTLSIPALGFSTEVKTRCPKAKIVRNHLTSIINCYEWEPIYVNFLPDDSEGLVNLYEWIYDIKAKKHTAKLELRSVERNKTNSWFMEGVIPMSIWHPSTEYHTLQIGFIFDSVIHGVMKHNTTDTKFTED